MTVIRFPRASLLLRLSGPVRAAVRAFEVPTATEAEPARLHLSIRSKRPTARATTGGALFQELIDWQQTLLDQRPLTQFTNLRAGFAGFVDACTSRAWIVARDGVWEAAAKNALLHFLVHSLPPRDGILVHAASVMTTRGTFLFPAPSATGKTTLARNAVAAGHWVLSDELNDVFRQGGAWAVGGTPLGRLSSGPLIRPLDAIFFLHQAARTEIQPISPADAASRLTADTFYPLDPPSIRSEAIATTVSLCRAVPCFSLGLGRDFTEWDRLASAAGR